MGVRAVQGACALGTEEHLCCLGRVLAELREVGWEEVTVSCGPQGHTGPAMQLGAVSKRNPIPFAASGITRDALQESRGEFSPWTEWLNMRTGSPGQSPSLALFKNEQTDTSGYGFMGMMVKDWT